MHREVAAPARLKRRLTITFVLVAGVATAALAGGSFFLVRQARLRDSLDRASEDVRRNLTLAADLSVGPELQARVDDFQLQRGVRTVALAGRTRIASDPSVSPEIPAELRSLVREGQIAYDRLEVRGVPYLAVGGRPPGSGVELYFLFGEGPLERDLRQLGTVLAAGWLAVVLLAAIVGRVVAGRTLAPIASASRAARRLAEGLLETRLPVTTDDEFGQWAASFNEMAEALEAKIAELQDAHARERRFTSDVAHELRTPLTALVSGASLLREHVDRMPEEVRRPAELVASDVARLRALVEDLMEISRFDAGAEGLARERVDLARVVQATLAARGWTSRVDLAAERVFASADGRRLERIVSNLVGNALDHGGSSVKVRVAVEGTSAVVVVADDGLGIAPEHLPHVFERFYKADPARASRGSGLGLAIALEHARLLGGDIEVESRIGEGTRFTLRLPVA